METNQWFGDDTIASIDRQRRLLAQAIEDVGPSSFTGEVVGKVRSFSGTSYLTLVGLDSDIELRTPDRFIPPRTRQGQVLRVFARPRYGPHDRNPVWQVEEPGQHHQCPSSIVRVASMGPFARQRENTAREFALPAQPISTLEDLRLPPKVRRIALICGRQSQVLQDFKNAVGAKKDPALKVDAYTGGIQGADAVRSISQTIRAENAKDAAHRADLIVIVRGGGSYADFLLFDDRLLVQHILDSQIPVATALGHSEHQPLAARAAAVNFDTPGRAGTEIRDYNWRNAPRKGPKYWELRTQVAELGQEKERLRVELDQLCGKAQADRRQTEMLHGENHRLRETNEWLRAQEARSLSCRFDESRRAAQARVDLKSLGNGLWWTLWAALTLAAAVLGHLATPAVVLWGFAPALWALLTFSGGARTARFLRAHPTPPLRGSEAERFIADLAAARNPRQVRQAVRRFSGKPSPSGRAT